jgi:hypothetical protein
MNTNITYCCSQTCPSRATCRRAHPPQDVAVPISNFYKDGQMCASYWPTGEKK